MTMLVCYASKKAMKEYIGQTLIHRETSHFGDEFRPEGVFTVAYRPTVWKHPQGSREFFARVTMKDNKIAKVE